MSRTEVKFFILRSIGNFLLLFAIFGVIATFGPALYFETEYRVIQARGITFRIAEADSISEVINPKPRASFGDLLTGKTEQEITPPDTQFSIVIPKIGAAAKIYPNIDPGNEESFLPTLTKGVAHSQGTVFPGMAGNIYLFAHSTDNFWNAGRYNAIFYLLKDLKEGDEVVIFYQGQRYNYTVTGSKVVDAGDVDHITQANTGQEELILQTCWPPGTTWKRLLVFARPSGDVEFKR
jgi:LPXTG-site transpeptidase (sortase) family protein